MYLITLLIVLAIFVSLVVYLWYANVIKRRNRVLEALSSIDVQLKKRHDLLPNVLRLANQYMTHERDLLEQVTQLRTSAQVSYDEKNAGDVKQHLEAEGGLQQGIRQIFAVAENYPDLRSSETIVEAQQNFNEAEAHIAAARRFYNAAVTRLNNAVQIFPGTVIGRMVGVEPMPFFELEDKAQRENVNVDDFLNVGNRGEQS